MTLFTLLMMSDMDSTSTGSPVLCFDFLIFCHLGTRHSIAMRVPIAMIPTATLVRVNETPHHCLVDDRAPKKKVSLWLSILFLAIPAGYALGYIFSVGTAALFGWRGAFIAEAVLMLPFVIFCFVIKPISLNMGEDTTPEGHTLQHHHRIYSLWIT